MSIVYETDPSFDALFLGDYHCVVRKSQIPGAGLGIVSMAHIGQGEDIFWKEQFCVVSDNHLPITCDNCLQWMGSSIDANGRMCGIGGSGLKVKSCAGCKVVRYCSKVSCPPQPFEKRQHIDMNFRLAKRGRGSFTITRNVGFWLAGTCRL
jgi:hypothetical protein